MIINVQHTAKKTECQWNYLLETTCMSLSDTIYYPMKSFVIGQLTGSYMLDSVPTYLDTLFS